MIFTHTHIVLGMYIFKINSFIVHSPLRVVFSDTVQWMTLEFSPECGTAQAEDSLQLYIPALGSRNVNDEDCNPYWPALHKFSNIPSQWPQSALLLPGMY